MAQALPRSHVPDTRDLQWISTSPALSPARQQLWRGLLWIAAVGGVGLGSLCLLVRVSQVDVECHRLELRCEELRAMIAADMTELSSLSDQAANLDRARRHGLCPPEALDAIVVSPELCPTTVSANALNGETSHVSAPYLSTSHSAF